MSDDKEEEFNKITVEDIQKASHLLADLLISDSNTCNRVTQLILIREEEIVDRLDLSLIASDVHGVMDPLGQLSAFLTNLINTAVSTIISSLTPVINGIVGTIRSAIESVVGGLRTVIDGVRTAIISTINTVANSISSAISLLRSSIEALIVRVAAAVQTITAAISSAVSTIVSSVTSALSSFQSAITSAISSAVNTIINALSSFANSIINTITNLLSTFTNTISQLLTSIANTIISTISNAISTLVNTITSFASTLINTITSLFSSFANAVMNTISQFASTIVNAISSAISTLVNTITSFASTLVNTITSLFSSFANTVINTFSQIASTIVNAVTQFGSWLFTQISNALNALGNFFQSILSAAAGHILNGIINAFETLRGAITPVLQTIYDGLVSTGQSVRSLFEFVVASFQDMASRVGAGFQQIALTFMGFTNAIMNVGAFIRDAISGLWDRLPDWLKGAFGHLGGFFKDIGEFPRWFSTNVLGNIYKWFKETFSITEFTSLVNQGLNTLMRWLSDAISRIGLTIWNGLTYIGGVAANIFTKTLKGIYGIGSGIAGMVSEFALSKVNELITSVFTGLKSHVDAMIPRIASGKSPGEILEAMGLFGLLVSTQFTFRMVAQALLWLGELTSDWNIAPAVTLNFVVGSKTFNMTIPLKFGNVLKHLASEFKAYSDELLRGFFYGLAIWVTQPIVKAINSVFRNVIPIEIPNLEIIREFTRRALPHKRYAEVVDKAKYFMSLQGYSDFVLNTFFEPATSYNLEIYDRFNTKRIVPLSLVYALPSASDIARMAIRDIFGMGKEAIDRFLQIYFAAGMHPDIGILFYLLHYRNPPPEKLWQFTVRGISGLLWVRITQDMQDSIRGEAERLGAAIPTSAADWNFRARELFTALQTYMTWQDYARFTWISQRLFNWDKNFTSDNQIVIDVLADIPTKIDQRWMVRWGLYDYISARGVGLNSPVREFAVKILDNAPVSQVMMDLRNFGRTVQATGLHPDWVPLVTVAETMNAFTEERTLLRTGFINLFKEGFYDVAALEKLLEGFVKASFHVSYFDMERMQWTSGWVNVPVAFLPAERKLLELRALMDRSLDILREVQRDIATAYQEFIVKDYDEFKTRLTSVIDAINEFYTKDYRAITGVDLPPEMRLKFVEDYYKPYVKALEHWRDVFTIRRARAWAMRWIGWVFYRVAIGAVSAKDVEDLLMFITSKAKLTAYESEFIMQILDKMYAMAASEYLPTPSTLASLSEYMQLDTNIVRSVLEERRVPEPWLSLWLKYIQVKPIKSDARALLNAYIRAFRLGVIPKETVQRFIDELPQHGFTPKEIEFITRTMELEEAIIEQRANKESYIPTPITLATISELFPEARALFNDIVRARRIPEEWARLWARYIDVRPMVDDIKRYLSITETMYVRFMVKREMMLRTLDEVREYLGFTRDEENFKLKTIELERMKTVWTELIGTVERLVSLSEYSPRAAEYAMGRLNEMIDALPISPVEKEILRSIWAEYIRNRPVKAEAKTYITQLINMYVDGLMTETTFKRELREMKQWGFSDHEIMFYEAQAALRKARKLRIPVGE